MRILVVDDHEVVRRGVASLLGSQPDFTICGEAFDGIDAVEKAKQLRPDVVVMDISMPKLNGLEATREIRSLLPGTEVLVLSQHDAAAMVQQAFRAGARGYVMKSSIARDLVAGVAKVAAHDSATEPASTAIVNRTLSSSHPPVVLLRKHGRPPSYVSKTGHILDRDSCSYAFCKK
jgi:DNA-binding NarL/FixJ family response regulator